MPQYDFTGLKAKQAGQESLRDDLLRRVFWPLRDSVITNLKDILYQASEQGVRGIKQLEWSHRSDDRVEVQFGIDGLYFLLVATNDVLAPDHLGRQAAQAIEARLFLYEDFGPTDIRPAMTISVGGIPNTPAEYEILLSAADEPHVIDEGSAEDPGVGARIAQRLFWFYADFEMSWQDQPLLRDLRMSELDRRRSYGFRSA